MTIVYCLVDSSRSGGMERVICTKANYLAEVAGYKVIIINTDRKSKTNFFEFSDKIEFIDLGIYYNEIDNLPLPKKLMIQLKKRNQHIKLLTKTLISLKPDICISTYSHELSFLYKIKDGSKKIAEIHFSKDYVKIENKYNRASVLSKTISEFNNYRKNLCVDKYDAFVVLTEEDKKKWENISSIYVIPNPLSFYPLEISENIAKKVITVGRLTTQKGYPYLIDAWKIVSQMYPDWELNIFGSGEDFSKLTELINNLGLENTVKIHPPIKNIEKCYLESSLYVMSSLYEGFGMVLAEAMACGLPCISFDCPSGPNEIIQEGIDGFLVECGDTQKLAKRIIYLIENGILRKDMGICAKENVKRFLPENIMPMWLSLFNKIIRN